jgi:hypothetical protein
MARPPGSLHERLHGTIFSRLLRVAPSEPVAPPNLSPELRASKPVFHQGAGRMQDLPGADQSRFPLAGPPGNAHSGTSIDSRGAAARPRHLDKPPLQILPTGVKYSLDQSTTRCCRGNGDRPVERERVADRLWHCPLIKCITDY